MRLFHVVLSLVVLRSSLRSFVGRRRRRISFVLAEHQQITDCVKFITAARSGKKREPSLPQSDDWPHYASRALISGADWLTERFVHSRDSADG
ncbi:unnamed protein product [Soboliphyme baturini]|uniref:Secreted protein n=1 Tax=Soboliphyme baturini TaxID=241478 RepID=A0A183IVI1_9BILA|nr:unnamed protein product [Soboliphyme baturini]